MGTRIVLVALVALLALPIVETASPVGAKQRSRTVTRTFNNTAEIHLPVVNTDLAVSGSLYPSPIAVRGLEGKIRDVNVRLNNLTHTFPADVRVLLVGPNGRTARLIERAGGDGDVTSVTLRLDDEATVALPVGFDTTLQSGAFQPTTAGSTTRFNDPAPEADANTALSIFDGGNPNGTWRLFILDGTARSDAGAIAGGWALEIEAKVKKKRKKR